MVDEFTLVRAAVGASAHENTVVAVSRVVGQRDELRRMLQNGGVHDAEARAALGASGDKTLVEAARDAYREIMRAEAERDTLLDGIQEALGETRPLPTPGALDALRHVLAELRQYPPLVDKLTQALDMDFDEPARIVGAAVERIEEFHAMREDRDMFEDEAKLARGQLQAMRESVARLANVAGIPVVASDELHRLSMADKEEESA